MLNASDRRTLLGGIVAALLLPLAACDVAAAEGGADGKLSASASNALAIINSDPRFTTWAALLKRAGLERYAGGSIPFTVFIPTEKAFDRYPDIRKRLSSGGDLFPSVDLLVRFVRSHVLYGAHPTLDFYGDQLKLASLTGTKIELTRATPVVLSWQSLDGRTGSATLSGSPIIASNAVIYPIDDPILVVLPAKADGEE